MVSSDRSFREDSGRHQSPLLPTPEQIVRALDDFVIGQDGPKRDLAVAAYNHYLSLAYAAHPAARHKDLGPQHVLMIGSTGSGKTYLVRVLARILGVPIVTASATSLVEVGYKGESVDSLLENLLAACGGDVQRAERGIIFVDEFDKIRKARADIGRDVSGEGVQNALLTLLDGQRTTTGGYHSRRTTLDVSKILFICAGAFADLPQIVRSRTDDAGFFGFGIGRELARLDIRSDDEAYACATPDDLIQYGFIPEILGRFAVISALRTLSEDELVRVLTEAGDSILEKQKTLFALHGIELCIPQESLREIARMASRLGTGARGLVSLFRNALEDVNWRLPDLQDDGVASVIITPETVRRIGGPILLRNDEPVPSEWASAVSPRPPMPKPNRRSGRKAPPVPDSKTLRASALRPNSGTSQKGQDRPSLSVSDTRGWSQEQIASRLNEVKQELDWVGTTGSAKRWWERFESENRTRTSIVLRLAEELLIRKTTLNEFFHAYIRSNCESIEGNLHFLDYSRIKKQEEAKRRQDAATAPEPAEDTDDSADPAEPDDHAAD